MKLLLVTVGKVRTPYLKEGCDDYARRIRKLAPLEVMEVKPVKGSEPDNAINKEGAGIINALDAAGFKTVVLHDRGKTLTSKEFAKLLGDVESSGAHGVAFVIGGAWGLRGDVVEKAQYGISLGKMTMSHELARLVLLEQIYRAQTTLRGIPYPK